jgi:cellulose synthase/poly-beta-1,6-N-acetylglucosamine synthase-like glycosyltransferase
MSIATDIVIVTFLAVSYTWIGYPAVLSAVTRLIRRPQIREQVNTPFISIIVACYNEEARIAAKLVDCLALSYPSDRIEILIASDGSTDSTEQIVEECAARDPRVRLLQSAGRVGKSGVQNLAAEEAQGEILLFTDAETLTRPDMLRQIAEDFSDARVGLVAPIVQFGRFDDPVSKGQGAYWRFELLLRQFESDLGILATASGAALAVRRNVFRAIPSQYGDDCIIPLDVCLQGYRVLQDPRCVVSDEMPHSISGEFRARIRMTTRNWSGILCRRAVLNPFRFPGIAWGLISHKFLRWMTPFFLSALLVSNGWMALHCHLVGLFILQSAFYMAALVGWCRSGGECERIFGYPFAFCLANLGFLFGILKSLRGQKVMAYK